MTINGGATRPFVGRRDVGTRSTETDGNLHDRRPDDIEQLRAAARPECVLEEGAPPSTLLRSNTRLACRAGPRPGNQEVQTTGNPTDAHVWQDWHRVMFSRLVL